MWPIVRRFGLIALAIVALWLGSVLTLNLTVYSPAGHVTSYLRALAVGDYVAAARHAGMSEVPAVVPLEGELQDVRILGSAAVPNGDIVVQAQYLLGGQTETTFFVVRAGEPVLYFFRTWTFERAPLGRLELVVPGDDRVDVNGRQLLVSRLGVPAQTSVFVPGLYVASLDTPWLVAPDTFAALTEVGERVQLRVPIEPTSQLVERTTAAVEGFLNDCVAQDVLQPVGCPFGVTITDRVVGTPKWTVLDYPDVSLQLGADRATWSLVANSGVAEVTVQVQSLFDGSLEEMAEIVPFRVLGVVRGTALDEPVLNLY
jgi:hypothetical protein